MRTRASSRAQALAGRMQLFLPLMSSLADPLIALMRDLHIRPADELLADAATWFDAPLPAVRAGTDGDMTDDPVAQRLRERIAALQPADDALASWDGALLSNALWRLQRVIDIWQDCRSLRALIGNEAGVWQPRYRHWRLGGTERFFDRGMMLFSTLTVVAAIVFASWLWIASGWHGAPPSRSWPCRAASSPRSTAATKRASGSRGWHWRLGGTERFDRGMMLFSTLTVVAAIVFASWRDRVRLARRRRRSASPCSFFAALG